MRYRLMATYRGAPYEAGIGPADGAVVLFAACPPPEELGFEPATGHWRKELRLQDVQAVWQSRPVGTFRGDSCIVLDDLGDRLHIGYLGHDAYRAEQLGYWQVDRGVFELVAARDEVTDIIEERTDYQPGPGPQSGAQPSYPPLPPLAPLAPLAELSYGLPAGQPRPDYLLTGAPPEPSRMPPADGGVTMPPPAAEPPLPLEAEAMRAASAASRRDQPGPPTAASPTTGAPPTTEVGATATPPAGFPGSPGSAALYGAPVPTATDVAAEAPLRLLAPSSPGGPYPSGTPDVAVPSAVGAQPQPSGDPGPGVGAGAGAGAESPRRRRSAGRRMATERIFGELASLAAIPVTSYSVGEEVEGALCLLETPGGFEVFSSAGGARHEVRVFSDEESACFYLFGVLAADAVRTGVLVPGASRVPASVSAPGGAPQR
jgi:hypothetical protein